MADEVTHKALVEFLLRQGDNALILGHRLSEWCGTGPALEEDIALANTSLDLIGQATLWLELGAQEAGGERTANDLAYLRDAWDFRNLLLVELPNEDFGRTRCLSTTILINRWQIPVSPPCPAPSDPYGTERLTKSCNWRNCPAQKARSRTKAGAMVVVIPNISDIYSRRCKCCNAPTRRPHGRHTPAWTTDWISADGLARLEQYGIAPPRQSGVPARCPRCHSNSVERVSQFGSTPCKAQWRCKECLEPFDYFKCL